LRANQRSQTTKQNNKTDKRTKPTIIQPSRQPNTVLGKPAKQNHDSTHQPTNHRKETYKSRQPIQPIKQPHIINHLSHSRISQSTIQQKSYSPNCESVTPTNLLRPITRYKPANLDSCGTNSDLSFNAICSVLYHRCIGYSSLRPMCCWKCVCVASGIQSHRCLA